MDHYLAWYQAQVAELDSLCEFAKLYYFLYVETHYDNVEAYLSFLLQIITLALQSSGTRHHLVATLVALEVKTREDLHQVKQLKQQFKWQFATTVDGVYLRMRSVLEEVFSDFVSNDAST